MDIDLAMILGFTLIAMWMIFHRPSWRRRRHERSEGADAPAEADKALAQEMLDQLNRLEERIQVLERIVTEDPNDLRRQFRDLGG